MALLHRFSRLLSADLHAVMDRLEDPDILLQQAQREMTSVVADERAQLERSERDINRIEQQLEQLGSKLGALQSELDLCFDANDEGLARSVIKRKLQVSAAHTDLQTRQAELLQQRRALEEKVIAHQADLDAIAAEAQRLAEVPHTSSHPADSEIGSVINDEAVELALLAERQARGGRA
ncbi:MAG: PspA/IM30 family protein [Pseudomonadales bacterium]